MNETESAVLTSFSDMLMTVEALIRSMPNLTIDEVTNEVIRQLDESTPNVDDSDSHGFVQLIRQHVKSELHDVIVSEAEQLICKQRCCRNYNRTYEELIEIMVTRVSASGSYFVLQKHLEDTIERLTRRYTADFDGELNLPVTTAAQRRRSVGSTFSDLDSLNSSFNYADMSLFKLDRFSELIEHCGTQFPIDIRIQSLTSLSRLVTPELLTEAQMSRLLPVLRDALQTNDEPLVLVALQIHARGLASSSHLAIREMYVNLTKCICERFSVQVPTLDEGILVSNQDHRILLHVFRLLNTCQLHVMEQWIRFPDPYVVAIVGYTVTALAVVGNGLSVTPLHVLSLLDVEGVWFRRWMNVGFGRGKLAKRLSEEGDWLKYIVDHVIEYIERFENAMANSMDFVYGKGSLEHTHAHALIRIVGGLLFHKEIGQLHVTHAQVVNVLCRSVFRLCTCVSFTGPKKYCLGHCIAGVLRDLLSDECPCREIMMDEELIQSLASPIMGKDSSDTDMLLSCGLLGRYAEINPSFLASCKDVCFRICELTVQLMKSGKAGCEPTLQLVHLCMVLYSNFVSVDVFLDSGLPELLYLACKEVEGSRDLLVTPVPYLDGPDNDCSSLHLRALAAFGSTATGLAKLREMGAVEECVYSIVHSYSTSVEVSTTDSDLLLRLTHFHEGMASLDECGFFETSVVDLCHLCEHGTTRFQKHRFLEVVAGVSWEHSERVAGVLLDKLLAYVTCPLTTLAGLVFEVDVPVWPLRSLRDLLNFAVGGFDDLGFDTERLELTCLSLIGGLVSGLDGSLMIQCHKDVRQRLMDAQCGNVYSGNGRVIIDELSLARHDVLVKMMCVGGPSEKAKSFCNRLVDDMVVAKNFDDVFSVCYIPWSNGVDNIDGSNETMNPLRQFVTNKELKAEAPYEIWRHLCARAFVETVEKMDGLEENLLLDVMEDCLRFLSDSRDPFVPLTMCEEEIDQMSDEYNLGMDLVLKYGSYLGFVNDDKVTKKELVHFLILCQGNWLQTINIKSRKVIGFPWLAATIFLMGRGQVDRCSAFFRCLFTPERSELVWLATPQGSTATCGSMIDVGTWIYHHVEEISAVEVPYVHSAFKVGFASFSNLCSLWLRQCFWNYLDWPEICYFVAISVLLGPSYIVFYMVTTILHMSEDILHQAQNGKLNGYLLDTPLKNYKVKKYLACMNSLAEKYNVHLTNSYNSYKRIGKKNVNLLSTYASSRYR